VQGSIKHRVAYTGSNNAVNGSCTVYLTKGHTLQVYQLCTGTPNSVATEEGTYLNISLINQFTSDYNASVVV